MRLYQKAIVTGLMLLAGLSGCKKQDSKVQSLDSIVGVPEMPATNISRFSEDMTFVLNLEDGKEIFCTYHGYNHNITINEIAGALIDAYNDKQKVKVSGYLDDNKMRFLEIDHPDFGKFKLEYGYKSKGELMHHPEYKSNHKIDE